MKNLVKFVSYREKRLWAATIVLILLIYFTLGLIREWLQALESSGWGTTLFVLGCFLILVWVVTRGMTILPRAKEIMVGLGIAVSYTLTFAQIEQPEERIHVVMYGVVALLLHAALIERYVPAKSLSLGFSVILITAALGTVDELIQLILPHRVFDVNDILYDLFASVMAVGANAALWWARESLSSPHHSGEN